MDFARIVRHLWYGNLQVSSRFPRAVLDRIEAALEESEKAHGGEIRFAVESSLDLSDLLRGETARDRAVEAFSRLRVWDTEANNGVLIYLLLADHDVEIIADRGIHAKVGPAGWEKVCREMEAAFRAGRFEEGVVGGIRAVGDLLARHHPKSGGDLNELPDAPVVL
jgi:uncharacterized membrane protein